LNPLIVGEKIMSEKQTKDEILEIIRLVDNNKPRLFKPKDFFLSFWPTFLLLVLLFIVAVPITYSNVSIVDRGIITLSALAILVAFMSFSSPATRFKLYEINFRRLEKFVKEDEKPLLWALIEIKGHIPFALEQIYKIHKEMFIKEKLMERLLD
jgi:hypothetical protein